MSKVRIWAAPAPVVDKGLVTRGPEAILEEIDVAELNANLRKVAADLDDILEGVETKGGFALKGIEIGLEITAEGGVNFIGTMTVGGKAAITLSFERG